MNGETPDRRWQLQEVEGRGKQWNLLDSEQELDDRWHLQPDEEYTRYEGANWRPIDDLPEERSGGAGWVLPSLVLVAVLAVAGYVAIVGFDRIGLGNINLGDLFSPAAQDGVSAAIATPGEGGEPQVTQEPSAGSGTQVVPTPTELPPTPTATLEPATSTPAPMVEKRTASVREQYGVNARNSPSTAGDPIEIVAQGTQLPIWDEQQNDEGDWYYVSLPNNTKAWVSAKFVDVTSAQVTYDEINQLRQAQGLPLLPTPTGAASVDTPVADNSSAAQPVAPTNDTNPAPVAVSAAISSPVGLNLRSEPNASAAAITLLADSLTFPVVGRSEDGTWLQLKIADDSLGWAATEFLRVTGDPSTLPAGGIASAPATPVGDVAPISSTTNVALTGTTATNITATVPPSTTAGVTGTTVTTGTAGTTASVVSLSGSRVRETATKDGAELALLNFGDVVKVLGRSEDSLYLQVELADGNRGWLLADTVEASSAVDALPVVQE
ncbi:MAG: SH3 domain-containing protein [Caldilineaceae bacterium]